jgi:hypothetical protein
MIKTRNRLKENVAIYVEKSIPDLYSIINIYQYTNVPVNARTFSPSYYFLLNKPLYA